MSDTAQLIPGLYREAAEQVRELARRSHLTDVRSDLLELSARFERLAAYADAAIRLGAPGHPHGEVVPIAAEYPLNASPGPARMTVLLVEDDPEVADMIALLLEEFGYEVRLAADAGQALSLVRRGDAIDLVFSDIVMPGGLNGVDLARTMRRRFPQIAVLLTTGYGTEAGTAREEGFAILPKPFCPDLLDQAIRDVLRPPAMTA